MKFEMKCYALLIMALLLGSCAVSSKAVETVYSEESDYNYILAVEAELSGDWDEALKKLKLALKESPDSDYLKTEISEVYLRMERIDDAIKIAEDVVNKSPSYEPAFTLLAKLYISRKEYQKAISVY